MPKPVRTPRPVRFGGWVMTDATTVIARYTPRMDNTARDHDTWDRIADFVRTTVTDADPHTPHTARNYLRAVTPFVTWAVDNDMPLDREVLFTPLVVEHHVAVGLTDLSPSSRGTRRSILSKIGRAITKRAGWPPPRLKLAGSEISDPYTDTEVALMRETAVHQKTDRRYRFMLGLLAGGLGAGLTPREHLLVTGSCVVEAHGGAYITVPGDNARPVAVRADWQNTLIALARRFPDEPLLGPVSLNSKNGLTNMTARLDLPDGCPRPLAARLRHTWMLHVLRHPGVLVSEFLSAAGIVSGKHIECLAPLIPLRTGKTVLDVLAGRLP